ncbi:hypothetical protein CU098_013919 [Rhizopus stolonifer]|uniref:Transcription factor domain-containing protein n=1 Tax=Rhizopus stolonifer TaxID=4846 RepID=A0A367KY36_RHIST|nr:hypothetical protein CU098_013919 [Rhizopus stolonifer]
MNSNCKVSYIIHNFSDLCNLLALRVPNNANKRTTQSTKANIKQALLAYNTSLPKSVRYLSASSELIENLMFRAIQNWCCISFKIVPIEIELLKHDTPKTILYCVAAITITSINPKNQSRQVEGKHNTDEGFKKDVAYHFYQRARHYLKEVIFEDDISVTAIQCYFCLCYTANLLRLPLERRAWQHLACETLKSKVAYVQDSKPIRQCWYRWYYIDAWLAISLGQDCLLPDQLPFRIEHQRQHRASHAYHGCMMSNDTLYDFAVMGQHIRRYTHAIRQGTLFYMYDALTTDMIAWWSNVNDQNLQLANCYYSLRLVLLFHLLHQDQYKVTFDLLLDGLDNTLHLLQGLQDLKLRGCDQSTYHHMFFAIHSTLKKILVHIRGNPGFHCLEAFAKKQFEMNLCILEGTNAFVDDIYQMRSIGATIEAEMCELGFIDHDIKGRKSQHVFRAEIMAKSAKKPKKSHTMH